MRGIIFDTNDNNKIGVISNVVQRVFENSIETIDNYKDKNLITTYHKHIISLKYDYIIGIEKGGFFAYYISELCHIPALIINPEFCYRTNPNIILSSGNKLGNLWDEKMFLLTLKHELIDGYKTLKFKMNDYQRQQSFIFDELTDVDNDCVKKVTESFIEKYKLIKGPTKEDKKQSKSKSYGSSLKKKLITEENDFFPPTYVESRPYRTPPQGESLDNQYRYTPLQEDEVERVENPRQTQETNTTSQSDLDWWSAATR